MLTKTQLEAREGKLTASRIAVLMNGDAAGILRLYKEMIGEEQPEDLSAVWPVQLGTVTEALNLHWYEMKAAVEIVTRQGKVVQHPQHEWAACTLDGWDKALDCPIECKHVGGREPLEVVIDRYQPQMQWQMECTGAKQCALSVIMGANAPVVEYIERDATYAAEMVKRGRQFMVCVAARIPPVVLDAVPLPADASKIYEMEGNNAWSAAAADWLDTREAKAKNAEAEKILKAMVPADAKKCHGHAIQITRDRAGRLSLREAT